jgi:hypothetical protein
MRGILTLSIALVTLACDRGEAPGDLAPRFTLCSGESNQVTCAQDPCGHRTQSQHGWGAACTGDNAACFRDANFAAAFPEGLYVGCGAQTATLLGSAAVAAALPASGTPRAAAGRGRRVRRRGRPDAGDRAVRADGRAEPERRVRRGAGVPRLHAEVQPAPIAAPSQTPKRR